MRSWRRFGVLAIIIAGVAVPLVLGFDRTDTMLTWLVALVLWGYGETELRLKTMQPQAGWHGGSVGSSHRR